MPISPLDNISEHLIDHEALGVKSTSVLDDRYVNVTGDTMTGELIIDSDTVGLKLGADQDIALTSNAAGKLILTPGVADTDITVNFVGTTNSGNLYWMEDEDYFLFSDDIMINDGENLVLGTTTGSQIGTGNTQKIGFWGATPVVQSTGWSVSNESTDTSFDADATSIDELADVLGTLIEQLKTYGILGA